MVPIVFFKLIFTKQIQIQLISFHLINFEHILSILIHVFKFSSNLFSANFLFFELVVIIAHSYSEVQFSVCLLSRAILFSVSGHLLRTNLLRIEH